MPKNLAYWEKKLEAARRVQRHVEREYERFQPWLEPPARWKQRHGRWVIAMTEKDFQSKRRWWLRFHRLASAAQRDKVKLERRIAFIQARIAVLRKKTAWDRVAGKTFV